MLDKYVHSESDEYYDSAKFDSREKAVEAGEKEYEGDFFVGKVVDYGNGGCFIPLSVDNLFDAMRENAYDTAGEFSEDWLCIDNQDEIKLLEEKIKAVVIEWMGETSNKPCFYTVEDTTTHGARCTTK